MLFSYLSSYLEKLENTSSRNAMIEILAELFAKVPPSVIDKTEYLLQGRVEPLYVATEFGMADKMVIKAIAVALDLDLKEVTNIYNQEGDLGITVEKLKSQSASWRTKLKTTTQNLKIEEVYSVLLKIAKTGGEGSVEVKVNLLADLFKNLDPLSARYVARIPVNNLRLGFSDMTVLDALSWMLSKSKVHRAEIEKAYNVYPDLGFIAKTIKEKGVEGLKNIQPEIFVPILMARAERLSSGEEIILKIGKCSVEPKIDGFRLQAHYKRVKSQESRVKNGVKHQVKLFTRNLEDSTYMYPDIVEAIKKQVKVDEAIFEGEAIAYNPETNEFLPFQETVQRKRKYNIEEVSKAVPLRFILFDLLCKDGESFISKSYSERRKTLEKIIDKDDVLILSEAKVTKDAREIENAFDDAVSRGLEGIVAKRLEGSYQAGARGFNWIKFKRSYASKLEDTIDAVVMGYNAGRGKRTSFGMGAFLIGVYNKKKDMYVTIAKIGTGLTDEEWKTLFTRCEKLKDLNRPALYDVDKMLVPNVWVKPEIIVEVKADEITRSSVHTAGRILKPSRSGEAFDVDVPGFALRFPRLIHFRDDKKPDDATTLAEIEEMFRSQGKQKT